MIEYVFVMILIIYLVIDNYRLRTQVSREMDKQKAYNLAICRSSFIHTNDVLFEGDVINMDEIEYDGTQEELLNHIFDGIVVGVDLE